MEAAAIEDKMERSLGRRGREEVQGTETANEIAAIQLCRGSFDRMRRDVDPQDLESAFREPKRIRPCPCANLERSGGPTRPAVTKSTSSGSGWPVSQGSSPVT